MTEIKSGTRMRCDQCATEVIVLVAADADLTCCGTPMSPLTPSPKR